MACTPSGGALILAMYMKIISTVIASGIATSVYVPTQNGFPLESDYPILRPHEIPVGGDHPREDRVDGGRILLVARTAASGWSFIPSWDWF